MAVSAFFVAVCLVYCAILITLQAKGNAFYIFKDKPDVPKGTTVKTVAVQAMRGEIYDRNGVPLVTNLYSYDLTLDHDPFVTTQGLSVRHRVLLSLMEHLTQPGSGQLTEDSFPLVGTYPDLSYSEEAKDPSTTVGRRLGILLSRVGLPEGASADALVSYYVNHYSLNTRVDGIPSYTGEEITSLLRIYYDMDLCQFGDASSEYTLAKGVSAALISAAKETDMVGVRFVVRSERVYHYPGYASHILGRVNKIFAEDWDYYNSLGYPMNAIVGVSGCEAAFESILHGTDGELELYVDEQGRVVSSRVTKEAVAGQDIRLTIDINLQMAAEDALREKLAGQLQYMTEKMGKLDFLPPMESFIQIRSIRQEQWLDLFRSIEKVTEYEYCILDLSEQVDGILEVLRQCDLVFTITREDGFAEAKMRQYEALLKSTQYEDIFMKTRRCQLPVFRELPAGILLLTHGELAACVRSILEEEGLGG
jgi:cell division protein FtsI/penicillin-binding protein 2